jgi:ketosteroid isomerase-like protein
MRTVHLLLLITLLPGCQLANDPSQRNASIATKMFEAFNQHRWKEMADYYAPQALFLDPSFGKDYVTKTREETTAKYAEMQEIFPDIRDDVKSLYPSGDKVIVEFVSSGTAPDGITFSLPIITVLTIRDGAIVRDATYYDNP